MSQSLSPYMGRVGLSVWASKAPEASSRTPGVETTVVAVNAVLYKVVGAKQRIQRRRRNVAVFKPVGCAACRGGGQRKRAW